MLEISDFHKILEVYTNYDGNYWGRHLKKIDPDYYPMKRYYHLTEKRSRILFIENLVAYLITSILLILIHTVAPDQDEFSVIMVMAFVCTVIACTFVNIIEIRMLKNITVPLFEKETQYFSRNDSKV